MRPLLWGVSLDTNPPTYEILFPPVPDSDFRVATVPFECPLHDITIARQLAVAAFDRLSKADLARLSALAVDIDRSALDRAAVPPSV